MPALEIGYLPFVICHLSFVIGHWSFVICRWLLVICRWSLVTSSHLQRDKGRLTDLSYTPRPTPYTLITTDSLFGVGLADAADKRYGERRD